MQTKEKAVVKAVPSGEWEYVQSRFSQLPKTPFRILVSGKSQSGRGVLTVNAVVNFWKECFEAVYVFASTVNVDTTWQTIAHHAYRHLQQGRKGEFMFNDFDETALSEIMERQRANIEKQKKDPDIKKLKGILIIIDDLSHHSEMHRHSTGILSKLMTLGRHYGISLWCNVHSINSLGSLARRQASAIIVFAIANSREYDSLREQYGKLVGLKEFDRIYDIAIREAPPYSFLTIHASSNNPARTFMLRFEAWLEPE
jgi:hypothetical protein